jgi:hypothetical protein
MIDRLKKRKYGGDRMSQAKRTAESKKQESKYGNNNKSVFHKKVRDGEEGG